MENLTTKTRRIQRKLQWFSVQKIFADFTDWREIKACG